MTEKNLWASVFVSKQKEQSIIEETKWYCYIGTLCCTTALYNKK